MCEIRLLYCLLPCHLSTGMRKTAFVGVTAASGRVADPFTFSSLRGGGGGAHSFIFGKTATHFILFYLCLHIFLSSSCPLLSPTNTYWSLGEINRSKKKMGAEVLKKMVGGGEDSFRLRVFSSSFPVPPTSTLSGIIGSSGPSCCPLVLFS